MATKSRGVFDTLQFWTPATPLFSINELLGRLPRFEDMEWNTSVSLMGFAYNSQYWTVTPGEDPILYPIAANPRHSACYFKNVFGHAYLARSYQEIQFLSDGKSKLEVFNEDYEVISCEGFDVKGIIEIKPEGDLSSTDFEEVVFSVKIATMGVLC